MKYLVIVIISVFTGFVGAWWWFDATVPDVSLASSTPGETHRRPPAEPTVIYRTVVDEFTFEQIENESSVFNQQLMAWHLAAQSDVPELEQLIERCLEKEDPLFSSNIVMILMEKYIALDPRGAFEYTRNQPKFNQDQMLGHVLTSWVRYDPESALEVFESITNARTRIAIGSRLLTDNTLREMGMMGRIEEALGPMAKQLVQGIEMQRGDPAELFESAMAANGRERQGRLTVALRRWMASDPEAALRRIASMSNETDRNFALQFALQSYANQDPQAALTWLRANDPRNRRLEAQILNSFVRSDIDQAMPLVEDFYRRTGDTTVLTQLVATWATTDPVRALTYADRFGANEKRSLYQAVATGYLNKHPAEGLDWVLALGPEYHQVKMSALSSLAFSNRELAERAMGRINDADIRSTLMQGIVRQRARYDPEGAMDWLSRYTDDPGYSGAISALAWQLANRNPARAAELIEPVMADNERGGQLVHPIFQSWYRQDPKAAVDWIYGLSDQQVRNQAISIAAGVVAQSNVDDALDMIEALPDGDIGRNARMQIASMWVMQEPQRVEEIIDQLDLTDEMAEAIRKQTTQAGFFR